jgi:hypothetical protein
MSAREAAIATRVDQLLTDQFTTTQIQYYPYLSSTKDIYKQRTKIFGTPVTLRGRAINNPTPDLISVIGNNERFDVAFLFSRNELIRRFPSADEGRWLSTDGEMSWFDRRYKIEKVKATGQVYVHFLITVVLGCTIQGQAEP